MENSMKRYIYLLLTSVFIFSGMSYANNANSARKYKDCFPYQEDDLKKSISYILRNYTEILNGSKLNGTAGQMKRWKRRFLKNARNTDIRCIKGPKDCKGIYGKAWIIGRIKICHKKMIDNGKSFCKRTSVLSHEIAHAAGIPSHIKHNSKNPPVDKPYRIGNETLRLCNNL